MFIYVHKYYQAKDVLLLKYMIEIESYIEKDKSPIMKEK